MLLREASATKQTRWWVAKRGATPQGPATTPPRLPRHSVPRNDKGGNHTVIASRSPERSEGAAKQSQTSPVFASEAKQSRRTGGNVVRG